MTVSLSVFCKPDAVRTNRRSGELSARPQKDAALCEAAGVDIIFHPEPEEMYADGFCSYVDMNGLTTELCGKAVRFTSVVCRRLC